MFKNLSELEVQFVFMINKAADAKKIGNALWMKKNLSDIVRGLRNLQARINELKSRLPGIYKSMKSDIEEEILVALAKCVPAIKGGREEELLDALEYVTSLKPRKLAAEIQALQQSLRKIKPAATLKLKGKAQRAA